MKILLAASVVLIGGFAGCANVPRNEAVALPVPAPVPVVAVREPVAISLELRQAAVDAVSEDPAVSGTAIRMLRSAGYAGLDAMIETHRKALDTWVARGARGRVAPAAAMDPAVERVAQRVDLVAMQKDAAYSRLYWHTNLDLAKREAQASGKPILSLRMLGNLNEELSCANSRFFRTILYPNAEVGAFLRQNFVLHWESVRPVPIITVDMGDGRKIVRTITGNSIHYVLDAQGRLIDGIPGLYGPAAFLSALKAAHEPAAQSAKLDEEAYQSALRSYSRNRWQQINASWKADLARAGMDDTKLPEALSDDEWKKIAALHASGSLPDESTWSLIQAKAPPAAVVPAEVAMRRTFEKSAVETPLLRMMANISSNAALDSVRNEYMMHTTIYQWLNSSTMPLSAFNNRVYDQLFKTPANDPWIGLSTPDIFSALPNDGLITASVTPRP